MTSFRNLILLFFNRYSLLVLLPLSGMVFAWRLSKIPSRMEITVFISLLIIIPSLKYPKIALYYLMSMPCFISFFRRLYYLISGRPPLDYLMLITDGAVAGLFLAILMLWIKNKEKQDKLAFLLFLFIAILLYKLFDSRGPLMQGMFFFKFYGLYIFMYFGGSSLINGRREIRNIFMWSSVILLITALYSLKQVLIGYAEFEHKWLDSVNFTTILIDDTIRTFSTYDSPAALSDAMVILFILGNYYLYQNILKYRLFGLILISASIPPLLLATVRTNWIGCIAGAWLFFVFSRKFRPLSVIFSILFVAVVLPTTLKYSSWSSESQNHDMRRKLSSDNESLTSTLITKRTDALLNPLEEYSLQKRLLTWDAIWMEVLHTRPFGRGLGQTNWAHSFYFQVLGDTGFPGAVIFLLILFLIIKRGITLVHHSEDVEKRLEVSTTLTLVLVISILNLTGTHLNSHPADMFFWTSAGMISMFFKQYNEDRQNDSTPELPEKKIS